MSSLLLRSLQRRIVLTLGAAAMLASTAVFAAPPINTLKNGLFGGRTDTAIIGYDTVAYFTDGKPVKGQDAFVTEWMGAKWKFASQAHLDLFKASPEKYAPQYGGYCAYGVSQDNLVEASSPTSSRSRRQALPQLRRRRPGQVAEGSRRLHQGRPTPSFRRC